MATPEAYLARGRGNRHTSDNVLLLREDPDLGLGLPADAIAASAVGVLTIPDGAWAPAADPPDAGALGLVVLSGHVSTCVEADRRTSLELLGPGDVLRPWARPESESLIASSFSWTAHGPAHLGVLDGTFAQRTATWPDVIARLTDRMTMRTRRLALQAAINSHPRVRERLELTLWNLADRWGRVTPTGVVLRVPLRHHHLALMIGAQRPTVSTELANLRRRGVMRQVPEGWLLLGDPPT